MYFYSPKVIQKDRMEFFWNLSSSSIHRENLPFHSSLGEKPTEILEPSAAFAKIIYLTLNHTGSTGAALVLSIFIGLLQRLKRPSYLDVKIHLYLGTRKFLESALLGLLKEHQKCYLFIVRKEKKSINNF